MLSLASNPSVAAVHDADPGQRMASALLRHLEPVAPVPAGLRTLIERAVLRLLDSSMLITDSLQPFQDLPAEYPTIPLPPSPHLDALEPVIGAIAEDGLAPHFMHLMAGIGKTLTWLHGTPEQLAQMVAWSQAGLHAGFFLTDRGGPSMQKDWLSVYTADCADSADGQERLVVDKIWGINALACDFSLIAARQAGRLAPVLLMVPPEATAQLRRAAVGQPYLDGSLQLGNIAGELALPAGCILPRGGAMGVKQYMSLVRPRFVRALCAHVGWLETQGRAVLSAPQRIALDYIAGTAQAMCRASVFSRYSEDAVMALKFAINEWMLHLVEQGAVRSLADQRDLLAFGKMEGSSYRCYFEIYTRGKGARHDG